MIKIHLVDSYEIFRTGLKSILEKNGAYRVTAEAATGHSGYMNFLEARPDVIIIDHFVAGTNGLFTAKRMLDAEKDARIILLSQMPNLNLIKDAVSAGIKSVLTKNIDNNLLISAVKSVLLGKRFFCSEIEEALLSQFLQNGKEADRFFSDNLSTREQMVLQLFAQGYKSAEIAQELYISEKTVETYKSRGMKKLNLSNTTELILFALHNGLFDLSSTFTENKISSFS
ncbi:MAG: response regulator transcription factor [Spirochaetia bacterium]